MAIRFSEAELAGRRAGACAEMGRRALDGMPLFGGEGLDWRTGRDRSRDLFFHSPCLGAEPLGRAPVDLVLR